MQSERVDEEAVSGRGAASRISIQELAVCQRRRGLSLYLLFLSILMLLLCKLIPPFSSFSVFLDDHPLHGAFIKNSRSGTKCSSESFRMSFVSGGN